MLNFVVRRLLQMGLSVLILSVLLFAWLRSLPGGPVSALLGERGTEEDRVALRSALGLDRPLPVQYLNFLERAVHGDFGISTMVQPGTDSMELFLDRLPATIELSAFAVFLAIAVGVPLGYVSARRHRSALDNMSVGLSLVGVAFPVFFLAFVLKYVFAIQLGWLPPSGRVTAGINATHVTGLYVFDGLLTGEWPVVWDALMHLFLPALALSSIPLSVIFRITRASVLDVIQEDHVRTARAKGLTKRVIRDRHVLRNALMPVVTIIGLQVGALLTGAVLTERVFNFRGLGHALAAGFETRDYAVLQVLILMAALTYIMMNLLVDVAYAVIDPRVRKA